MKISLGIVGMEVRDIAAQAVSDASNYQPIYTLQVAGRPCIVRLKVGAGGGLGGFRLTIAATSGGEHKPWRTGDDFATATTDCRVLFAENSPPALQSTAAGGEFILYLGGIAAEIGIEAKKSSNNTTIQALEVSAFSRLHN